MFHVDPAAPLTNQLRSINLDRHCLGDGALLYRFRDKEGVLLYVGVTVNPIVRWQAHKNVANWWSLVATAEVETHPYMNAALDAEVVAIRGEFPRFNLRSSAEPPTGDSAASCGKAPQGKGREGIRKGTPIQDQSAYLTVGALCSCSADAHPTVSYALLGLEPMA